MDNRTINLLESMNEKLDRILALLEEKADKDQPKQINEMKIIIRDHMLEVFEKYKKMLEDKKKSWTSRNLNRNNLLFIMDIIMTQLDQTNPSTDNQQSPSIPFRSTRHENFPPILLIQINPGWGVVKVNRTPWK